MTSSSSPAGPGVQYGPCRSPSSPRPRSAAISVQCRGGHVFQREVRPTSRPMAADSWSEIGPGMAFLTDTLPAGHDAGKLVPVKIDLDLPFEEHRDMNAAVLICLPCACTSRSQRGSNAAIRAFASATGAAHRGAAPQHRWPASRRPNASCAFHSFACWSRNWPESAKGRVATMRSSPVKCPHSVSVLSACNA